MELRVGGSHFSSLLGISLLGGLTALSSLLLYQSIVSSLPVGSRNIQSLAETAYVVLALVLAGVCLSLGGVTRYFMLRSPRNGATKSSLTVIVLSHALNDKKSFRVFILGSVIYGIFFAFVSSFLVYQPLGSFSESYGASVPSMLPVICCGSLGQMPQFVVYLTHQFAILIVPVNLILLLTVSWLVGINAGIATYAYKNRASNVRPQWFGGFGAIVGLFTACPTCAGFFLLTMLGLSGAVTLAVTLSSLQAVFIAVGLPLLLIAPVLTARKIPNGCGVS